jgi:hypothetical protein
MTRALAPRILWTASAAAALGLGVLAVSAVDADADAAPGTRPASATSSQQPTQPSTPSPEAGPAAAAAGEQVTVAGTVSATCDGGVPSSVGTPAHGWWLDDSPRLGEVEFENGSQKLEVTITCVDGTPQFFVEGPRADDSGRGGGSPASSAPSAPSAPAPTSGRGYDDSAGRVGGGHGSADGPGDDSAGRVGGDHGSDDGPGDDSGRGRGGDDD